MQDDEHPDDAVVRKIAWTMFAGPDATYLAGEYVPSDDELALARKFVDTMRTEGFAVVPATMLRETYLVPDRACGHRWFVSWGEHKSVTATCDQRGEHAVHDGPVTVDDPFGMLGPARLRWSL